MASGCPADHGGSPTAGFAISREFSGRPGRTLIADGVELFLLHHQAPTRGHSHVHESAHLSWLLCGEYRDHLPDGWRAQSPLEVVVRPPHYEHQDRIGVRGAIFLCARMTDPLALENTVDWPNGPRLLGSTRGAAVAARLYRSISSQLSSARVATVVEQVYEIIELACSHRGPETRAPNWLRRARERVRSEFRMAPRLTDLACEAQVHPGYLARAYRRAFGVSPAEESRMLRDATFLAELTTDRPIAELAHELGYADQAHASRAIKSVWGEAPSELRRRMARA